MVGERPTWKLTLKPTPNLQHYTTLNHSPWCRSAHAHGVMVLGALSDGTSYRPPLPPYRVVTWSTLSQGGSRWV